MTTITQHVSFVTHNRRKCITDAPAPAPEVMQPRIPRVAKLMALAIRFDGLLNDGTVKDMADLARLARVTQPRMTQIMNLRHLAPDIQEELLMLEGSPTGRDPIHEKMLRPISAEMSWARQRKMWRKIKPD